MMRNLLILLLFLLLTGCAPAITPEPTATLVPTTTNTSTPIPTATKIPTPTIIPIHPSGQIVFHQANEEIKYSWYSYLPQAISKDEPVFIWVTGANAAVPPTDDYETFAERVRHYARASKDMAISLHLVSLIPVIPRPMTNHVYAVSFDWKVFLSTSDPFVQHPELVLNLMLDQLTADLRHDGYQVEDKIFIDGYSAGCIFAQAYTILQPERVKAMAGGACGGSLVMPVSHVDDTEVNWPSGINDFESLIGYPFNLEAFQEIPHFIYIGDLDDKNSTLTHTGELWRNWGQINFLNRTFGENDPERLQNQVQYLNQNGFPLFTFKMYPDVVHEITSLMLQDTRLFFQNVKPSIPKEPTPIPTSSLPGKIDGNAD